MGLKLNSSGGGSVTINPPVTASALTLTAPAVNGNLITSGDTGTVTGTMIASATVAQSNLSQGFTRMTAVASTSGTSIDFTGIPSWVKRITVTFYNVSTSGTSNKLIQLGSGSVTSTGYTSTFTYHQAGTSVGTATTGFGIYTVAATDTVYGNMTISNITGNSWLYSFHGMYGSAGVLGGGGGIALSGVLDRIRLTTVNGTDTFDLGTVNVMYE